MAPRRTALGREFGVGHRAYVFLTADAVEVDEVDGLDVARTRVLLDDVMLVTLHKRPPWGLFWTVVLLMAFFVLVIGLFPWRWQVLLVVLPFFVPVLVALLVRVIFGVHYVSVFGRRSKARMAWYLRGARARATFALLLERVAERQAPARAAAAGAPLASGPG